MTGGKGADGGAAGIVPRRHRLFEPATALIAAATLLPCLLFVLAAWKSHGDALREAAERADRTTRVLEEHALKVFETHRLVIQQVNGQLRFADLAKVEERAEFHRILGTLQKQLDQVATISVTDREGSVVVSNRAYQFEPKLSVADRDWFEALKKTDLALPYVSRSYRGRQSGKDIFNVAGRVHKPSSRGFDGAITVSADRAYFESFYDKIEPTFDHSVLLMREDGAILARVPPDERSMLRPDAPLRAHIINASVGHYRSVSRVDGIDRIIAYRKVGPYPVYVRFGLSVNAALAPWRDSLFAYGLVAALASLALVGASILALRRTERERHARQRWQETAAALRLEAAERSRIEDQLRQSQKMEALGRLTGGVAHDFNNLLTAVIGSLDLVRRRKSQVDPRTLDLVGNALEGAHRAASLTSRLLAFSRQQPLKSVSVDANRVVAGMFEMLRRTLGETVTIKTALADELWSIASDPNQLESAILNLAVNARDAMPNGGILTIKTANAGEDGSDGGPTDVAPGDYVSIVVADTGTGMPPAVLAKIFEPFYTTKPVGRGTGLGLSQVYGFVNQCGGHISVRSEEGRGTCFEILLPRLKQVPVAGSVADDAPPASVPVMGRGETILVVEDEPMVLRLSAAILEEAGYRVVTATDGRSALDLFRNEDVALLFTDVVLGGAMNGRVLADAILQESPGLPVLFTSGYTGDAIVHDGRLDDGPVLAKPFSGDALVERVAALIALREHGKVPLPAL